MFFFNLKTKAHTKTVIKNNLACKNNSIPKKAATPLPPLNFIKIEKQWPIIMKTTKSLKIEPNNLFVINRVKKPFKKSKKKVSKADFLIQCATYLWHQDFLIQLPKDFEFEIFYYKLLQMELIL